MVLGFKHNGDLVAGRVLARLLALHISRTATAAWQGRVVVPMPMRDSRLRERGFNQAERIARIVAGELRLPLEQSLAWRVRSARDQKRLSAFDRHENIRGAFVAGDCGGRRVAIVDDVITTGASADALAAAFLRAGAADVVVWGVARVL